MNKLLLAILINSFFFTSAISQEKRKSKDTKPVDVTFPSLDTLNISATLYEIDKTSPAIVLCHQAGYNKFEYDGIARELNKIGFNCLAIDQRSGGAISSMQNETFIRAMEKGKSTSFFDAEQDMIAAVNYATNKYKKPVILWGSSYSSTFALYLGRDNRNILAVVAFSPGNYFEAQKGSLIDFLTQYKKPFFIASSKQEIPTIKELLKKTNLAENQTWFQPTQFGKHGSSSLWDYPYETNEYWKAIKIFLDKLKK
jgi:dienelactone hydrolase